MRFQLAVGTLWITVREQQQPKKCGFATIDELWAQFRVKFNAFCIAPKLDWRQACKTLLGKVLQGIADPGKKFLLCRMFGLVGEPGECAEHDQLFKDGFARCPFSPFRLHCQRRINRRPLLGMGDGARDGALPPRIGAARQRRCHRALAGDERCRRQPFRRAANGLGERVGRGFTALAGGDLAGEGGAADRQTCRRLGCRHVRRQQHAGCAGHGGEGCFEFCQYVNHGSLRLKVTTNYTKTSILARKMKNMHLKDVDFHPASAVSATCPRHAPSARHRDSCALETFQSAFLDRHFAGRPACNLRLKFYNCS